MTAGSFRPKIVRLIISYSIQVYPQPYLLTPYQGPQMETQYNYKVAHARGLM